MPSYLPAAQSHYLIGPDGHASWPMAIYLKLKHNIKCKWLFQDVEFKLFLNLVICMLYFLFLDLWDKMIKQKFTLEKLNMSRSDCDSMALTQWFIEDSDFLSWNLVWSRLTTDWWIMKSLWCLCDAVKLQHQTELHIIKYEEHKWNDDFIISYLNQLTASSPLSGGRRKLSLRLLIKSWMKTNDLQEVASQVWKCVCVCVDVLHVVVAVIRWWPVGAFSASRPMSAGIGWSSPATLKDKRYRKWMDGLMDGCFTRCLSCFLWQQKVFTSIDLSIIQSR